jgi:hypothetical protein
MEKLIEKAKTLIEAIPYQTFRADLVIKYGECQIDGARWARLDVVLMRYIGINP